MDAWNSVARYSLRHRNNALSVSNNMSAHRKRAGLSGHFWGCLFSRLGDGRRGLRLFARSDAARRRAEVAHACLDVAPHGIGSAVVALIFSMAKREVTFLSGTAAIRRL